jgi:hypothetical protein
MTDDHRDKDDDQGNRSKATGASGGGSFGNQRGAPVTGGAPEQGKRGSGDVHPSPDAIAGGDRASRASEEPGRDER